MSYMLESAGCSNLVLRHNVVGILGYTGQYQTLHKEYANDNWVSIVGKGVGGASRRTAYEAEDPIANNAHNNFLAYSIVCICDMCACV